MGKISVTRLPRNCPGWSAEEFFGGGADHDGARVAREEQQTVFEAGHHGVHVFAHGAENFVHAAQLLADLRDFAADLAEFVARSAEACHFGSGRVELAGGDAVQLRGNASEGR